MSKSRQSAKGAAAGGSPPAPVRWALVAAVALLSFLAFLPALGQGFVEWDDDRLFEQNPNWRGLSSANVDWMFADFEWDGSFYMGHYQPLTWVTLALDYEIVGGMEGVAEQIHRTNMLLHSATAVLFALLAMRLLAWRDGRKLREAGWAVWVGGALAGLLFGVHPLRVESVAWATERRDVLSSFFLMGTLHAWLSLVRSRDLRMFWWGPVLGLYVLSLLSKAWGMTLPVVLLAMDGYPLRRTQGEEARSWGRLAIEKLPFVPFAALTAWLAARAQGDMAAASLDAHGVLERAAQAAYGLTFYVVKTLLPLNLTPLYELEIDLDITEPRYMGAMAFVLVTTVVLWLLRKRLPAGWYAWVIYGIVVSPVLGLLQSGAQRVADRYSYLSCLPFALLVGGAVYLWMRRESASAETGSSASTPGQRPSPRAWAPALVAGVFVLLLTVMTYGQTQVWKDSETLWSHTARLQPQSYIAHHQLSAIYSRQGRVDEALQSSLRSVEAHPGKGNEAARHHLGNLYRRKGKYEEGLNAWREALDVAPRYVPLLQVVVPELERQQLKDEAEQRIERALEAEPDYIHGRVDLANFLLARGRLFDAEDELKKALEEDRTFAPALHSMGVVLFRSERVAQGEQYLREADRYDPDNPNVLTDLGVVLAQQQKFDAARAIWNRVLQLDPGNQRATGYLRQLDQGS